jgi:hypothetical protein
MFACAVGGGHIASLEWLLGQGLIKKDDFFSGISSVVPLFAVAFLEDKRDVAQWLLDKDFIDQKSLDSGCGKQALAFYIQAAKMKKIPEAELMAGIQAYLLMFGQKIADATKATQFSNEIYELLTDDAPAVRTTTSEQFRHFLRDKAKKQEESISGQIPRVLRDVSRLPKKAGNSIPALAESKAETSEPIAAPSAAPLAATPVCTPASEPSQPILREEIKKQEESISEQVPRVLKDVSRRPQEASTSIPVIAESKAETSAAPIAAPSAAPLTTTPVRTPASEPSQPTLREKTKKQEESISEQVPGFFKRFSLILKNMTMTKQRSNEVDNDAIELDTFEVQPPSSPAATEPKAESSEPTAAPSAAP